MKKDFTSQRNRKMFKNHLRSINFCIFVYNTRNMKTITISDEVYEKLVRIEMLIESAEKKLDTKMSWREYPRRSERVLR